MIAVVAQATRTLIQVAGAVVLARLLAPEDFGLVAMATTATVFISMFTDLGLSGATVQSREITQKLVSTLFAINIVAGAGLWLVAAAVAPFMAWFYGDPRVMPLILVLAAGIPLSAVGSQHNALLIRRMSWFRVQIVSTAALIAGFVFAILSIVVFNFGYWALAVQQIGYGAVALVLNWTLCRWRPSLPINFREARSAISFGGYLTAFNVINYFHRQADNALIGWRWGSVELGYYSRAYSLLTLPLVMINQAATSVALPALSRLQHDRTALYSAYMQMVTLVSMAGVGLCAILFATASPLILIILGPAWQEVIPLFRILSISSVLATSANTCSWVFTSQGETRKLMRWSLIATPIFLVSYFIGLPWGGRGVALSYAIAMAFLAPGLFLYTLRETTISPSQMFKAQLPIYIAAILAGGSGFFVAEAAADLNVFIQLIVSGFAAAAVYGSLSCAFLLLMPQYAKPRAVLEGLVGRFTASLRRGG
jgi:PST family polysaccharide transporter